MIANFFLRCRFIAAIAIFYIVAQTLHSFSPFKTLSSVRLRRARTSSDPSHSDKTTNLSVSSAWPLKIWQTAKESLPAQDQTTQKGVLSWAAMNPSHRYELITFDRAASFAHEHVHRDPELLADFMAVKDPILRADLARYILLLIEGGTYTDLDTSCLKPISEWVPLHLQDKVNIIFGIEGDSLGGPLIPGFSHHVQFSSWTMRAKPGHMIMKMIIERVRTQLHNLAERQNTTMENIKANYMDVIDTTGPGVFTESIFQGLSIISGTEVSSSNLTNLTEPILFGDVLILPVTRFAAGTGHSNSGYVNDPQALVRHYFAGSWKKEHPKETAVEKGATGKEAIINSLATDGGARKEASRKEASRKEASRKEASRKEAIINSLATEGVAKKEALKKEALRKEASRQAAFRKEAFRKGEAPEAPGKTLQMLNGMELRV